jgi:osmotically inducible protein OsmC
MQRKASAVWKGTLKEGKGTVSTDSGTLRESPYTFGTRFETQAGTNPEELLAAAHAGCFSMALANQLGTQGLNPESIETKATLTLEKQEAGFTITGINLDVTARVPNADRTKFEEAANKAKTGCIISRALNTNITLTTKLVAERAA